MKDNNIDFSKNINSNDYTIPENITNGVDNLLNYFDQNNIDYDQFNIDDYKKAYPNYEQFTSIPGTHNLEKWINAVKQILHSEKNGFNRVNSIKNVTNGWKEMEVFDFLNWMKFYDKNDHLKYKKAQFFQSSIPNYFLKLKDEGGLSDKKDIDFSDDSLVNKLPLSEKKRIIERHRNKIVSRLDSAEKLLRTDEGELFAGKELASLIKSIYELKTKIQLVNKLSLATRLYEDMIIREANIFYSKGQVKSYNFLKKIAGDSEVDSKSLLGAEPTPPTTVSGDIGGLPSMGPGMPQTPGKPEGNNNPDLLVEPLQVEIKDESAGIEGFLNNLNGAGIVPADELEADDFLITEAQAVPVAPAQQKPPLTKTPSPVTNQPPQPQVKKQPISVNVKDDINVKEDDDIKSSSDVDNMINSMFSKITINDVIVKLEDLSKIFNTREIPRQLAIVDMMLDSLGLATYFPSLPEATNKSLESNNYIASRIDDILSKLRGTMSTNNIDLNGKDTVRPEVSNIKNNLEQQDEKDQKRKEMRKQKEDKALEQSVKEEPEIDLGDLEQNIPTQQVPAQPQKPLTTKV